MVGSINVVLVKWGWNRARPCLWFGYDPRGKHRYHGHEKQLRAQIRKQLRATLDITVATTLVYWGKCIETKFEPNTVMLRSRSFDNLQTVRWLVFISFQHFRNSEACEFWQSQLSSAGDSELKFYFYFSKSLKYQTLQFLMAIS